MKQNYNIFLANLTENDQLMLESLLQLLSGKFNHDFTFMPNIQQADIVFVDIDTMQGKQYHQKYLQQTHCTIAFSSDEALSQAYDYVLRKPLRAENLFQVLNHTCQKANLLSVNKQDIIQQNIIHIEKKPPIISEKKPLPIKKPEQVQVQETKLEPITDIANSIVTFLGKLTHPIVKLTDINTKEYIYINKASNHYITSAEPTALLKLLKQPIKQFKIEYPEALKTDDANTLSSLDKLYYLLATVLVKHGFYPGIYPNEQAFFLKRMIDFRIISDKTDKKEYTRLSSYMMIHSVSINEMLQYTKMSLEKITIWINTCYSIGFLHIEEKSSSKKRANSKKLNKQLIDKIRSRLSLSY